MEIITIGRKMKFQGAKVIYFTLNKQLVSLNIRRQRCFRKMQRNNPDL